MFARVMKLFKSQNKSSMAIIILSFVVALLLICTTVMAMRYKESPSSRVTKFGLQNIGELATQSGFFTSVQTIENSRNIFGLDIPFTEKKYIFSYDGVIKAGINFSEVEVSVNDVLKKIEVKMPETIILSNQVDKDSFTIYHDGKNPFNSLDISELNEAEQVMEKEIEREAVENGLLSAARDNAKLVIQGFISGFYDLSIYSVEFLEENEVK